MRVVGEFEAREYTAKDGGAKTSLDLKAFRTNLLGKKSEGAAPQAETPRYGNGKAEVYEDDDPLPF